MEVKMFGKVLGEAEGWDQPADNCLFFYAFKPNAFGKEFLNCPMDGPIDFQLDYVEGTFQYMLSVEPYTPQDLSVNWSILA